MRLLQFCTMTGFNVIPCTLQNLLSARMLTGTCHQLQSLSVLLHLNFNLFILSQMYDGFVNLSIPSQKVFQFSCLISLSLFFALIAALLISLLFYSISI
jgi:hypothetical protein